MTQTSLFNPVHNSRLVQLLSEFRLTADQASNKRFGERLGKLIDLSDSFALADAHYQLSRIRFQQEITDIEQISDEFFRVRGLLIKKIVKSFVADSNARFKVPRPGTQTGLDDPTKFEPYRRFYAIQQREMDVQIQRLRMNVRKSIAGVSEPLAQLAALDEAIGSTLAPHVGKSLATIPRLLEERFQYYLDKSESSALEGFLDNFLHDMQALLLAECSLRCEPILGLIEALNHHEVEKSDD